MVELSTDSSSMTPLGAENEDVSSVFRSSRAMLWKEKSLKKGLALNRAGLLWRAGLAVESHSTAWFIGLPQTDCTDDENEQWPTSCNRF